jgi:hypothetical protein
MSRCSSKLRQQYSSYAKGGHLDCHAPVRVDRRHTQRRKRCGATACAMAVHVIPMHRATCAKMASGHAQSRAL